MSSREEITELLSDYAWAMDAAEFGRLNDVFTSDASFSIEIPGMDTVGPFSPRKEIVDFVTGSVSGMEDQRRHVATNFRFVNLGEDAGEVTSTLTLISVADGKATIVSTGVYEVTVAKEDGAWRMSSMVIKLDLPFG
ncbi:MAG: hypothetical protein BGO11_02815 [Solirubrobacterales bacterium 70-9]|nr:MAG: hypothetical protein BGO11_02815 [Solirubrobacterales bacterium 70-9]